MMDKVEYAGFTYRIIIDGNRVTAVPEPGQHAAAWKDKHRRAAVEEWKQCSRNLTLAPGE